MSPWVEITQRQRNFRLPEGHSLRLPQGATPSGPAGFLPGLYGHLLVEPVGDDDEPLVGSL